MLLDQISSFLQVVLVDLVLAGDNVIVVGMVAATVAADQRRHLGAQLQHRRLVRRHGFPFRLDDRPIVPCRMLHRSDVQ